MFVSLVTRYACNTSYVSDPQPGRPPRYNELADRIDPNTADWQTLAALPGIGERKARDIVEYRERKRAEARDPGLIVFDAEGDLLYVRGIGPALIEAMRPHLLFPSANRSATSKAL
jgi:DNA uptake protein ComE-like DNA-binding protein